MYPDKVKMLYENIQMYSVASKIGLIIKVVLFSDWNKVFGRDVCPTDRPVDDLGHRQDGHGLAGQGEGLGRRARVRSPQRGTDHHQVDAQHPCQHLGLGRH